MIEELRVGLFAQAIGTPRPVSEQRVYKAIDQLTGLRGPLVCRPAAIGDGSVTRAERRRR